MSTPGSTRTAPRHHLSIGLRFHREGMIRSGVTENVSATGLYIRAGHVPSAGEIVTLTLNEMMHGLRVEIVSEVRWGRGAPSLDFPEPGFGVHFVEIYASHTHQASLVEFLTDLGVEQPSSRVRIETRGERSLAVCHFT